MVRAEIYVESKGWNEQEEFVIGKMENLKILGLDNMQF